MVIYGWYKMALATEKLYYRRSDTTYSINLYTATSDVGTDYLSVRVGGNTRYAKIVATTDSLASHLRIRKDGVTKAVATTAITYVGVWTQFLSNSSTFSYSYSTNYYDENRLYGETFTVNGTGPYNFWLGRSYAYYYIDGVQYHKGDANANVHLVLSTGNHTVGIRAASGSTAILNGVA
jgi:hypothetical protein